MKGYITYIFQAKEKVNRKKLYEILKNEWSLESTNFIKGIKEKNSKTMVFDIPEVYKPEMQKLIKKTKS